MSRTVKFSEFGCGHEKDIYVVVRQVTHFKPYCDSRDSGTMIFLDDGTQLLVGNHPEAVRKEIEGKTYKDGNKPEPIPPSLRQVRWLY